MTLRNWRRRGATVLILLPLASLCAPLSAQPAQTNQQDGFPWLKIPWLSPPAPAEEPKPLRPKPKAAVKREAKPAAPKEEKPRDAASQSAPGKPEAGKTEAGKTEVGKTEVGKIDPAAPPPPEAPPPPYEPQILRLAEILGALAYLGDLCGSKDDWRSKMQDFLEAEARGGDRKERLAGAFNRSFHDYEQSYRSCSPNAQIVIGRFLDEGGKLARDVANRFSAS